MIARAAGAFVSLRRERMLASGPDGPAPWANRVSPSSGTSSDAPRRGAGPVPDNLAWSESASGT